MSGEHIADYICAQEFGWGRDWDGHDKGSDGVWLEGKPSAQKMGKLSRGGSPKSQHILYRLTDPANDTGIDSVWRANPSNNNGHRFAVVEAKASRREDGPKFLNGIGNARKPGIRAKLATTPIYSPEELLEPIDLPTEGDDGAESGVVPQRSRSRSQSKIKSNSSKQKNNELKQSKKLKDLIVQMSREWISLNLGKAVGDGLTVLVSSSYSRHLFFTPVYHPSGSPKAHVLAQLAGSSDQHEVHDAFHFGEAEIKSAVNAKKRALRKKYGSTPSLAEEK